MGNYFIDELTSETSLAYSITDEILLFGNYNLNYFNKRESTLLDERASISGLTLSNTEKPTRATSQGVTLIDHGFSSKNQIQDVSKLTVFTFLLSTSNEKFIYSVMSHNQNHDYYNVKIRFRFFRFLSTCKIVLLHFMRLLLSGDIHLNPGPFSHIRESDMLIDIVTKDCKNRNICLFNALVSSKTNMTFSLTF